MTTPLVPVPLRTKLRRLTLAGTLAWAKTVPFTWVIAALSATAGISRLLLGEGARQALDNFIASGFDSVVVEHHWLSSLTTVFFVRGPVELALVILMLGFSERLLGTWRTVVTYVVVVVLGTGLGVGLQALGIEMGSLWSTSARAVHFSDTFLPLAGTLMAASAFAAPLLRRRIRVLGFAGLAMFVLYSGEPSDLYRLIGALLGLTLGVLFHGRPWRRRSLRSSHREIRSLIGSVVAITAVGPIITIMSRSTFGPLKPLGLLLQSSLDPQAEAITNCTTDTFSRACVQASVLARLDGVGPVLLTVLPLLALLVAAYGIIRGRRIGLWLAVAINVMLAALAAAYYGIFPQITTSQYFVYPNGRIDEYNVLIAVSVAVPLASAVLLFLSRRFFPTDFHGGSPKVFAARVGAMFATLSIVYLGIAVALRDHFDPVASPRDLLLDLPERFIPVGFLTFERIEINPTGALMTIVYHWIGPLFWIGLIVLAFVGIRDGQLGRDRNDDRRVRALLRDGAGGSLSWMATWPGNQYWIAADGQAAVAYRVIAGIALTTGQPICRPGRLNFALTEFADFATNHGWTPAFYSVSDEVRPALEKRHWSMLQVAEETLIYPLDWSLEGKKMQNIRTAINRATKTGITAEWTTFHRLTPSYALQIRDISEEWVAEKDLPEMGFTLGGIDELEDPDVALMLAVDEVGRVLAVTSWIPTYLDGKIDGWTLDFMRRRADATPGTMEFLIAQSVLRARETGVRFMSLSGAPLARSPRSDDTDVRKDRTVDALLGFLGAALEPVYGFQSLHDFKKRFRPETRPLYLAYPDPLALPATALCLARAYAPTMSSRQALSLLSRPAPAPAAAAQPMPTPEENTATQNARTPAK